MPKDDLSRLEFTAPGPAATLPRHRTATKMRWNFQGCPLADAPQQCRYRDLKMETRFLACLFLCFLLLRRKYIRETLLLNLNRNCNQGCFHTMDKDAMGCQAVHVLMYRTCATKHQHSCCPMCCMQRCKCFNMQELLAFRVNARRVVSHI